MHRPPNSSLTHGLLLQKPLRRFLRVALLIPLFVGCFYTKFNDQSSHVRSVFRTLTRLLGCLLLFFFANVLKTLVAKIMASHFHKEAHFEKMQEALQKVQPRFFAALTPVWEGCSNPCPACSSLCTAQAQCAAESAVVLKIRSMLQTCAHLQNMLFASEKLPLVWPAPPSTAQSMALLSRGGFCLCAQHTLQRAALCLVERLFLSSQRQSGRAVIRCQASTAACCAAIVSAPGMQ